MKITNRCLALSALQCIFILSWLTSDVLGLQGASGKESTILGLQPLTPPQPQTRIAPPAPISQVPPAWRRSGSRGRTSHMTSTLPGSQMNGPAGTWCLIACCMDLIATRGRLLRFSTMNTRADSKNSHCYSIVINFSLSTSGPGHFTTVTTPPRAQISQGL